MKPPHAGPVCFEIRRRAQSGVPLALRLSEDGSLLTPRARAARHRMIAAIWPDAYAATIALSMPGASVRDVAAAVATDEGLRAAGATPQRFWLDIDEADLSRLPRAPLAAGLERLKSRGWRLALRLARGAPLALDSRMRTIFAELIADAALLGEALDPSDPIWLRLLAGRASGLMLTCAGAASPEVIQTIGFDAIESPLSAGLEARQTPATRSVLRSAASSLSSR